MPLSNALFKSQDQSEQDLTEGPGWTIDDQKPGFFSNALEAIPRGIAQGGSDALSVLAHGFQYGGHQSPMDAVMDGPLAARQATEEYEGKQPEGLAPWKQDFNQKMIDTEAASRDYSKSLIPDPRVTGTGANLLQGFSKAVTEFSAGSAAGGPLAGASLLGASEGYAHYQDLKDQGVDDETAKKSGLLTAVTAGGSAVLPMGMPAKWLAGLSTPGTLLAQAGAGAAINTSFGAASRYASAKILEDAGYPEQAKTQEPWDAMNVLTDALSGLFFGAHAGWHGLKTADVDPSIRDAAKVVQDRQEVNDRAPGVPVDMKSSAVHREALETALGDLMSDRPVDLAHVDTEGATFARPEIDEAPTADIIREEFKKSGVLDFADDFDRWLKGEEPRAPKEVRIEGPSVLRLFHGEAPEGEGVQAFPDAQGQYFTEERKLAEGYAGPKGKVSSFDVQMENPMRTTENMAYISPKQRAEIEAKGHDSVISERNGIREYTIFDRSKAKSAPEPSHVSPGALADRPDLQIVNEHGEALHAGETQQKAIEAEAQANKEAEPMHQAAVECEVRHA